MAFHLNRSSPRIFSLFDPIILAEVAEKQPTTRLSAEERVVVSLVPSSPRSPAGRSIVGATAKPFTLPAMSRKRGNPNWGRAQPFPTAAATEFAGSTAATHRKPVPVRQSCVDGVSTTEIDATFRNGCWVCGESR